MIQYDKDALLYREEKLKDIFLIAKNVLDTLGIKFIVTCGTCLGAVRNGRLLPWDINLNFLIPLGDCPECNRYDNNLFYRMLKTFEPLVSIDYGIKWEDWDKLWAEGWLKNIGTSLWFSDSIRIEVAVKYLPDTEYIYSPLEQVELYGHKVYVPTPPDKYLSWAYGSSWKDVYCPWKDWYTGHSKKVMAGTIHEDLIKFTKEVKKWWC